jgi:P2 family phage contractile tail tube protein
VSLIPDKLVNFRAYGGPGSKELIGTTDVELPELNPLVDKIMGAGIAGEIESPVIGHFQSLTAKVKWRITTAQVLALLAPVAQTFDFRGSAQLLDSQLGTVTTQPVRISINGRQKGFKPGKFEPGKPMETDCDIEVEKLLIVVADVEIIELDKLNMIFKVNGTDYLESVRSDLGGV